MGENNENDTCKSCNIKDIPRNIYVVAVVDGYFSYTHTVKVIFTGGGGPNVLLNALLI
jgi:hypothetical protein